MAERTFAELEGRPKPASGCRVCGAETKGVVYIQARAYGPEPGSLKKGRTLNSRSASLCESCTVERYEAVEEALTRV